MRHMDSGAKTSDHPRMPAIGTTTFPELHEVLTKHRAKLKASEVHALFLGAQTSTSLRLGPQHLVDRIFGDSPALERLPGGPMQVFAVVFGYWNHLLDERRAGRVRLAPLLLSEGATRAEIRAYAATRHEELTWYVRGIDAGGDDPIEFRADGQKVHQQLAKTRVFLRAYASMKELQDEDANAMHTARKLVLEMIAIIEQLISELMDVSDEVRREAIATFQARRGSMTDDGVQVGGPRVPRNAPCPCGSGKKWKKCCGSVIQPQ